MEVIVFSLNHVKVRVFASTTLFKVRFSGPLNSLSIRVTKSHTYRWLEVETIQPKTESMILDWSSDIEVVSRFNEAQSTNLQSRLVLR